MGFQVGVGVTLALILAVLYEYLIYPAFLSPLAKIPNAHWSSGFSPAWLLWMKWTQQENRQVYRLHMSKGAAIRLAPNLISVNGFEDGIKTIYQGGFPKPPSFYFNGFAVYGIGNLFTIEDNDVHLAQKKLLSPTFTKTFIMSSQTLRAATREVLFRRTLPLIFEAARAGTALEMIELDYSYFLDTFTHWQFGRSIGSNLVQDLEERRLYLDGFFSISHYTFWQYQFPRLANNLRRIGIYLIPKKVDTDFQKVEEWNLQKCDEAQQLLATKQNISLDDQPTVFERAYAGMSNVKSEPGRYPRRIELASEMFSLNSGAFETSGNTSTYTFYELSRHPEWQHKLREELLALPKPLVYIHGKDIELDDLADARDLDTLPILQAIIMETMRLWPSVPGGQPRMAPKPCSLGGYNDIPTGTVVQSYACVLHRTPEVFPDPDQWMPERWLEAGKDELTMMKRWFWGFGSGGRGCLGMNVAIYSIKFLFASVYTNFTTSIHDCGDMTPIDNYLAGPKGHRVEIKFHPIT
ncbi:hypothetical protein PV10_02727 [Exophiala mesophila]|uniref:Cytochrome P450 n=1 Tax=Exophiala mesophila TaxID=212818 RepID=A0A0D1WZW4_EXOME|nr:uncharacterized protein PV10_02727 [Exophiala mesophila]KIV95020.1 hypothetical protein PV10_02727 [Exophiala mesophila]